MDTADATARSSSLLAAAAAKGVEIAEYVEPVHHHVVVAGHRLHVLEWGGDAGAPAVLFLHGVRLTAHTWDLVCLGLRGPLRPYALDLRGHGDSEWSPVRDYRISSVGADVAGVIDWIGGPVHLVGHSFGALVATAVASSRPELVRRLVLVDAGPRADSSRTRRERASRGRREVERGQHFATFDEAVATALRLNPRRDERLLRSSLRNNLREHPDGSWSWKYDDLGVGPGASFDFAAAARVWDDFAHLDVETLVVRGSASRLFTADDAALTASVRPTVRVTEVDGSGHNVQGDQPGGLLAELRPFLVGS